MSALAVTGGIREAGRGFVSLIVRQQALWLPFIFLVAAVASASAQTGSTIPTVETIVARMAHARAKTQIRFRPYSVTRVYKLFAF